MQLKDQVVWITGASSGIGEALVYACVKEGAQVVASARRESELNRVKEACGPHADQVYVLPLDLTQTEKAASWAKEVHDQFGHIDLLVNNGGMSQRSRVDETPLDNDRRIMEVNFFGQVALTKAVLPYMKAQGNGHLVAISSITGKFGFPLRSAYSASKHAIHGFFETVLLEMKPFGVRVTIVNPGRVRTPISLSAIKADGTAQGTMDAGLDAGITPESCAQQILKAVRKNRAEVNIGGKELLMVYLKRWVPGLFRRIASNIDPR
ncbi:SDR family oxidoreductase [Pontibacter sp. G13]|uniref:SDR family oxidoreductase n=1 Tax=Pontibacter sp. G13 TaxID=3074898 RepID=UPI0028892F4E|nr:SDR family oxidoreductase [Pontibacter sp. G13]WNJ20806.1 SDR family oxidoreductase [Pontibacter sp. G13]